MRPQMSTYGHPAMITPELDALANKSLVFDFAYTQVRPSRALVCELYAA